MDGPPLLEVTNVGYGTPEGRTLQETLSLKVHPGQLCLITGPNGCGKSTLLKVLLGQHRTSQGEVTWNVPRNEVGYLPQHENGSHPLPITLGDLLRWKTEEDLKDNALFSDLEPNWLDRPWNEASGGERKRCLVARALMKKPRFLLLDEPLNHLDTSSRVHIMAALGHALHSGMGGVMVNHLGLNEQERKGIDVVPLKLKEEKWPSSFKST